MSDSGEQEQQQRAKKTKAPWIILGVILAASVWVGSGDGGSDDDAAAAADEAPSQTYLQIASDACLDSSMSNASVGDGGASMTLAGVGAPSNPEGSAAVGDLVCVLQRLQTPDSVLSRMDATTALAGQQTADWDDFTAAWTYHPDNGLTVVLTEDTSLF